MAFEEGFYDCSGDVYCSRDSQDPRGYRMDRLGLLGDQRIQHVFKARGGSIDVSYPHVGMDSIWLSDSPNWV
jgi:hypothetical protein